MPHRRSGWRSVRRQRFPRSRGLPGRRWRSGPGRQRGGFRWIRSWGPLVGCLWYCTGSGCRGSIPQPLQKLTRVNPAEGGGLTVVGAEVIPETVLLCCLAGSGPADGAIVGVGAVPEDLGEGGRAHRIGCGCLWYCSRSAGGSTLPVVGNLERPYHLLQVGSIDVLLTVLGDLPGLGAVGVGDTVDPLNTNGLQMEDRFGDQHQRGVGGTGSIVADRRGGQRPSRYSPMIMPFWRTWAYPYSSERERQRSQARSSSVVSFSQGAEGQITES